MVLSFTALSSASLVMVIVKKMLGNVTKFLGNTRFCFSSKFQFLSKRDPFNLQIWIWSSKLVHDLIEKILN